MVEENETQSQKLAKKSTKLGHTVGLSCRRIRNIQAEATGSRLMATYQNPRHTIPNFVQRLKLSITLARSPQHLVWVA